MCIFLDNLCACKKLDLQEVTFKTKRKYFTSDLFLLIISITFKNLIEK